MPGKVIGIDLGTTNSCVAVDGGGQPTVIANRRAREPRPRWSAFTENGERLVGQIAKRQAITNPENTVFAIKRLIGRKFERSQRAKRRACPYKIVARRNGDVRVEIRDREYSPPEISAMMLQKMKQIAEDYLGERSPKRSSPCPRTSTTPAPGDQGRRQDRRPRSPAHHQRADRRRARLRPRQEKGRAHRRLRPRRRHVRYLDPRDRRRRVRGRSTTRRHVPRRRRLRRRASSTGWSTSFGKRHGIDLPRTAWPCSA